MARADEHRFLTPAEAAHRLGITEDGLTRLRCAGNGPDWITINRLVRYSLADLNWLACPPQSELLTDTRGKGVRVTDSDPLAVSRTVLTLAVLRP